MQDGYLQDYLLVPEMHRGALGVHSMQDSAGVIAGRSYPLNGAFSVADPRFDPSAAWKDGQAYGVRRWEASTGAIAGQQGPGQGAYSVADPRHHGPAKHSNEFRIVRYEDTARAVTGAHGTGNASQTRARVGIGTATTSKLWIGSGQRVRLSPAVRACRADGCPSLTHAGTGPRAGDHYLTAGHYGVAAWDKHVGAVSASACHDNGSWSVADPRALPAANDKLVCRIISEDGTWHRPFTTLELAALQSIYDPDDYAEAEANGEPFQMDGTSDSAHRERIGNAVPRKAAKAMAEKSAAPSCCLGRAKRSSCRPRPYGSVQSSRPWPCAVENRTMVERIRETGHTSAAPAATASTAIILYMRYGRMRLTMSELAAELGIKEGSLRNLISDDKCAVATTEGRNRYADVRAVGEYLDQRYREASLISER